MPFNSSSLTGLQPYRIAVDMSIMSITQYPLIGIYCLVMTLMTSCATSPPSRAALFGRSAVGARTLNNEATLRSAEQREEREDIHFTRSIAEVFGQICVWC